MNSALTRSGTDAGGSRDRRAMLGVASLAGARGAAVLLTLVSVPLTLPHLGVERFGVWMTISSIVALLNFLDLGILGSLLTSVAEDDGRDDEEAASVHTSTAFVSLTVMAAASGVAFAAVYPFVPWGELYNVSSDRAADEAGPATAIMVGCFLLSLPLMVVQRVQLGYQQGLRKGLWDTAGSMVALAGILAVVAAGGSLPVLVAAFAGGPVVAALVNNVLWFGRARPALRPRLARVRRAVAIDLVRLGSVYMLLQLAAVVTFFSDALIIARILGPEAVTDYSVAWKLFSLISVTVALAFMPLWPSYSEAAARGDVRWVRATLARSIRLTLIVTVPASGVLLLAGGPTIDVWTDSRADPPFGLMAALAGCAVLYSVGVAIGMFMNALKIVRLQLVVAVAMAIVNVVLSIALTRAIGVEGVVIGTLLSYGIIALVPLSLAIPRTLRDLDERAATGPRAAPTAALAVEPPPSNA